VLNAKLLTNKRKTAALERLDEIKADDESNDDYVNLLTAHSKHSMKS
jgi:hypothetical protein